VHYLLHGVLRFCALRCCRNHLQVLQWLSVKSVQAMVFSYRLHDDFVAVEACALLRAAPSCIIYFRYWYRNLDAGNLLYPKECRYYAVFCQARMAQMGILRPETDASNELRRFKIIYHFSDYSIVV
jgi:hypothetical protein